MGTLIGKPAAAEVIYTVLMEYKDEDGGLQVEAACTTSRKETADYVCSRLIEDLRSGKLNPEKVVDFYVDEDQLFINTSVEDDILTAYSLVADADEYLTNLKKAIYNFEEMDFYVDDERKNHD